MYAQELFVHDSSEWQCTERLHASIVDALRVLVLTWFRPQSVNVSLLDNECKERLTLELECKIVCEMPALVISTKQEQRFGIPYFQ